MTIEDIRPRTLHMLKLREQYVRPIIECKMRYQIRLNDRGYQAGDIIKFTVVGINGEPIDLNELDEKQGYCTKNEVQLLEGREYRVDFVTNMEGLEAGFVVFSISDNKKKSL